VLTAARFVPLVREQLPELPSENIVGEPIRRDTAAAVALGTLLLERMHGSGTTVVLTADHRIEPIVEFQRTLGSACRAARANPASLYTFGITPAYPATAYGYLERGETLSKETPRHFRLETFVEKPSLERARRYVESGRFLWNSGMFVWSQDAIFAEFERLLPAHLRRLRPAADAFGTAAFPARLAEAFEAIDSISIDYGVMEHARDVRCVEATFEWSDVGGWLALEPYLHCDGAGNAARGHIHARRARDNIVFSEDEDEDVALLGVEGLIVVRAGRRTLVCRREDAEAIKRLVGDLPERLR